TFFDSWSDTSSLMFNSIDLTEVCPLIYNTSIDL
ncbi:hypothetical protein ABH966_004005, partial [Lysinibacillus sp. RC46]